MNIFNPGFLFIILSLALLAGAIAIHVSSASLSLPITPLTLITILIPIISIPNALLRSRLLSAAISSQARTERILPAALQTLQVIPTTAIATLLLQHFLPGTTLLECALSSKWQRMFAAKDSSAIRSVQDSFDCCGFNSVRDRAWPFPNAQHPDPLRCAHRFDRDTACVGPWGAATRRNAGLDLGIVLAVALMQIATVLIARPAGTWRNTWWARGWAGPREEPRNLIEDRERVRPLLEGPEAGEEEEEDDDEPVAYRDLSPTMVISQQQNYGTNANGSRAETSVPERNAWIAD